MAEYLHLYSDFAKNPKTQLLRRRLGSDGVLALVHLWCATADSYPRGDLAGKPDEFIEILADWTGEAGAFTRTLRELGFLDGAEGNSQIHNWSARQPYVASRPERQQTAQSAARSRWKKHESNDTRSQRLAKARVLGKHTAQEWQALINVCGNVCARCHQRGTLVKDHIVPIYQGGSDSVDNLQPFCDKCNKAKGPDATDYRPPNWRHLLENVCETSAERLPPEQINPTQKSKNEEKNKNADFHKCPKCGGAWPDAFRTCPFCRAEREQTPKRPIAVMSKPGTPAADGTGVAG